MYLYYAQIHCFFMQAYWYFCSMLLDVKIHWCSFLDLATALEFDAYMSVCFYLHMDKQCCNHSKDNNQFISGGYNFLMEYICNFYLDGLLKDYLLQTWEVNSNLSCRKLLLLCTFLTIAAMINPKFCMLISHYGHPQFSLLRELCYIFSGIELKEKICSGPLKN